MKINGICENKCQVDITNKLNNFVNLEELGFTVETSLSTIVESMDETGILIYNVNPPDTSVYPTVYSGTVVIQKSNDKVFVIYFSSEKEVYINKYANEHLEDWRHLSTFSPKGSFTITFSSIGSGAELPANYQFKSYGISSNCYNAVVTPIGTNFGFDLSYAYGINPSGNSLWFRVKNNTSKTLTNIQFKVTVF